MAACSKEGHWEILRGVFIQKEHPANRPVQQAASQKLYAEVPFTFHVIQQEFLEIPVYIVVEKMSITMLYMIMLIKKKPKQPKTSELHSELFQTNLNHSVFWYCY